MSVFASNVIWLMHADVQGYENDPFRMAAWISRQQDADAVVNAFPLLLLNEDDRLVDCLDHCIDLIPRFSTFNLKNKIRLLRAQRG